MRFMALRKALPLASTLSVDTPRPRCTWPLYSTSTLTSPWANAGPLMQPANARHATVRGKLIDLLNDRFRLAHEVGVCDRERHSGEQSESSRIQRDRDP